jgi:hypothetical protein
MTCYIAWGPILPLEISKRGSRGNSQIELKPRPVFDFHVQCGGLWNAESPGGGSALGVPLRSLRPLGPRGSSALVATRLGPSGLVPFTQWSARWCGGRRPCTARLCCLIWEPQVVFLGLPIPPLTDREEPPRSGSRYQNSALAGMQQSAAAGSDPPQRHGALRPPL